MVYAITGFVCPDMAHGYRLERIANACAHRHGERISAASGCERRLNVKRRSLQLAAADPYTQSQSAIEKKRGMKQRGGSSLWI
jgi:hypothetical protein